MSIRLSTSGAQLKVTLSSALTIPANAPFIMSGCFRLMSNLNDNAMVCALVDVDPNSTVSRRVYSDPDTPLDATIGDSSAGGVGAYQSATTTWYGFVLQRTAGGTASFRLFPDSSSTTPVNPGGSVGGDTAALSAFDTILIGDIEPSVRRACDMEICNLKVQTGVDGWDDTRARYELDHFAFQAADGTERYAWELEDLDADSHGLNERGGSGANLAVIAGTVAASANRPSQLEAQGGGGGSIGYDDGDGPVWTTVQRSGPSVRLF